MRHRLASVEGVPDTTDEYGFRLSGRDVVVHCTSAECTFSDELPVVVVDEVLYDEPTDVPAWPPSTSSRASSSDPRPGGSSAWRPLHATFACHSGRAPPAVGTAGHDRRGLRCGHPASALRQTDQSRRSSPLQRRSGLLGPGARAFTGRTVALYPPSVSTTTELLLSAGGLRGGSPVRRAHAAVGCRRPPPSSQPPLPCWNCPRW